MKDCPLFSGHLNKTHHQSRSLATSSYILCPPSSLYTALTSCYLRQHPHTHSVHQSLCTMHSFTCWYLRQHPHRHSVHQSLCTTHALTHLLVSRATSSYTLCTPISSRVQPYFSMSLEQQTITTHQHVFRKGLLP